MILGDILLNFLFRGRQQARSPEGVGSAEASVRKGDEVPLRDQFGRY